MENKSASPAKPKQYDQSRDATGPNQTKLWISCPLPDNDATYQFVSGLELEKEDEASCRKMLADVARGRVTLEQLRKENCVHINSDLIVQYSYEREPMWYE